MSESNAYSCAKNDIYEEEIDEGYDGKPKDSAPMTDPLHPYDPRSDDYALTPVYRGNQNQMFNIVDKYNDHSWTYNAPDIKRNSVPWDGKPMSIWISDTSTQAEIDAHRTAVYNFLFPNDSFILRGLQEVYEATMPFADTTNPRPREIEAWHHVVLNHFRTLVDLPGVSFDHNLFIRSAWSNERKNTDIWDTLYPDDTCGQNSAQHCGATFIPDEKHQPPYFNEFRVDPTNADKPRIITGSPGSEGILQWWNGDFSWAFSRLIRQNIRGKTMSGHAGPFWFRPNAGYAHMGDKHPGAIRIKWSGSQTQPPPGYTY